MVDIGTLFPAIHPYVGGVIGTAHGKGFYEKDAETACVKNAEFQVGLIYKLLKDGAALVSLNI